VGNIITLPEDVSAKIAAGEVIEGPFSVVRELVDNAVDAESSHIRIIISNGGKDLVQVIDDGSGMSAEDGLLAVQKHTTSKIRTIEDLDSITSMGFRGEALASICAVSEFTMITRRAEEIHGVRVRCDAGSAFRSEPVGANPGTEIIIRNLFRNLPARRKFLKSNRAETAKVKKEIVRKSLNFHRIGFSFTADDRVVFNLDPRSVLLERIVDLFGEPFRENLLPITHEDELFRVHGYVSNRKLSLPNRQGQYLFVNGRPVTDRSLLFAINNPGRGTVPSGRWFYAFLFISLDPSLVDVNVHPAKKEVKIKPADRLYAAVYHSVERALSRGYYGMQMFSGPAVQNRTGRNGPSSSSLEDTPYTTEGYRRLQHRQQERFFSHPPPGVVRDRTSGATPISRLEKLTFEEGMPSDTLDGIFGTTEWDLRYLGGLFNTFLIFETKNSVILVDQHAAHERVCYERFKRIYEEGGAVKRLLVPINFTPPASKYELTFDSAQGFRQAGMEIEPFGDESFNILTLPAFIPENREEETIALLFEEFYEGKLRITAEDIREHFVKLAACRAAIKEGYTVGPDEARALMEDLLAAEVPFVCPHGRPTMVRYSIEYFEKLFKRR
jgi:DNA mismatch repair protein MutL